MVSFDAAIKNKLATAHSNLDVKKQDLSTVAGYLSKILIDPGASKKNVDTAISEPDAIN